MTAPHPGLVGRPVYLDYNGTTPIDPAVVEAMAPYLSVEFGNPSSTHAYGVRASVALTRAREQVSSLVSGRGGRVVFTGSGSEADALAIRGAVLAAIDAGRSRAHVVTQVTEHPAVLAACRYLEQRHAVLVTYLGVDAHGRVDPDELGAALTQDTVLVSIMHANNETGTLQPVAEIAAITRDHGVLLHCDAAQSIGKVEVDVDALGVDLLTIVGHKMYAPKGIAALYVREGVPLVRSSGAAARSSGCGPAPRTSRTPSGSVRPRSWRPRPCREESRGDWSPCGTGCTSNWKAACRAGCTSTGIPWIGCPTHST